ncbi:MAG: DNA primase [Roseovarius sp.]|nr:DNA primase [Roseovarius sp.]
MSWDNYDEVLDQMVAYGLTFEGRDLPLEVGRMRRLKVEGTRERKGWYILHELRLDDGTLLLVGSYGIWLGQDNGAKKVELKKRQLTDDQRAAMKARLAEDRKKAKQQRDREAARAAQRANAAWLKCADTWTPPGGVPTSTNGYLMRKGVKAHGVRFSAAGVMVVPMMDNQGRAHGVQFVYDKASADHATHIKKNEGQDKKFWPFGMQMAGKYFLIGPSPDITGIVLVAEGYATAATLLEATGLPVAVSFTAGNMQPVGAELRKRYKRARLLFCADDDAYGKCPSCKKLTPQPTETCAHCGEEIPKLKNAGVTAADLAALAIPNSAYVVPTFTDEEARRVKAMEQGIKISDFNDLQQAETSASVTLQIEGRLGELKWQANNRPAPTRTPGEEGESELPSTWTLDTLLPDYALIYGTETVFDGRLRRIISLSSLRAAGGKSLVRMWLEHPGRRTVLPEQVGFDPTGKDREILCNLWGGWPTQPKQGTCDKLLELLEWLCSNEDNPQEVFDWILQWLAYPIQHPGAKMQTAILMHGPEGTGKNIFFSAVRKLYAKYGGIFSQTELESQFNGWASGKLFMIGNEVVTRVELYHQQGRLKNMVTETEWQVNEKNLPTRMEANHCNFVFFSNRIDIAKLDREDRRYCVVWTPHALDELFYRSVAEELRSGGIEALHHHLATLDITGFDAHSKPPMTRSKRELIELGMDSTERFWHQWTNGELNVPCCPCTSRDLYLAYQQWGKVEGVPKLAQLNTLIGTLGKKPNTAQGPMNHYKNLNFKPSDKTKSRLFVPPPASVPSEWENPHTSQKTNLRPQDTETQSQWLTRCIVTFRNALEEK